MTTEKSEWDGKCDGCGKPIEEHTELLHCPHGVDDDACKECYEEESK